MECENKEIMVFIDYSYSDRTEISSLTVDVGEDGGVGIERCAVCPNRLKKLTSDSCALEHVRHAGGSVRVISCAHNIGVLTMAKMHKAKDLLEGNK